MPRVYVSQAAVDRWLSGGQADLRGDVLQIETAPAPISLFIHPAVLFESVEGAESDPLDLVGCVKSSEELTKIGAEHYDTSVVVGEHAFVVQPGFLAVPLGADGTELRPDRAQWSAMVEQLSALET